MVCCCCCHILYRACPVSRTLQDGAKPESTSSGQYTEEEVVIVGETPDDAKLREKKGKNKRSKSQMS